MRITQHSDNRPELPHSRHASRPLAGSEVVVMGGQGCDPISVMGGLRRTRPVISSAAVLSGAARNLALAFCWESSTARRGHSPASPGEATSKLKARNPVRDGRADSVSVDKWSYRATPTMSRTESPQHGGARNDRSDPSEAYPALLPVSRALKTQM